MCFKIIIPSTQLRTKTLLEYNIDKLVFIYKDELNLYKSLKHCDLVTIDTDNEIFKGVKSIQAKRCFIEMYCRSNNINKAHFFDDDVLPFFKRNGKVIKFKEGLKIHEESLTMNGISLFRSANDYLPRGTMSVNFDLCKKSFRNSLVHEDICFVQDNSDVGIKRHNIFNVYSDVKSTFKTQTELVNNTVKLFPELKVYFKELK